MRPRLKNQSPPSPIRVAKTTEDWNRLIQAAIQMAEKTGDSRVAGLREALAKGQTERFLRKLGIVCPSDLMREFPIKP